MKKLLLCLLFTVTTCYADVCEICHVEFEPPVIFINNGGWSYLTPVSATTNANMIWPHNSYREEKVLFELELSTHSICQSCSDKYKSDMNAKMNRLYDDLISRYIKESKFIRKSNEDLAKAKEVYNLKQQLECNKKQIEELQKSIQAAEKAIQSKGKVKEYKPNDNEFIIGAGTLTTSSNTLNGRVPLSTGTGR